MKDLSAYQAALEAAVFFHQRNTGYLRLSGEDRVDFIQRQSTNDLRKLTRNQSVMTVLTSPTARILDVIRVVDEGQSLGMIPLPGRSEKTAKFLQSRIFFSDQVEVLDIRSNFEQVHLFGPQATAMLQAWGIQPPQLDQVTTETLGDQTVKVIHQRMFSHPNYTLLVPGHSVHAVLSLLAQSGIAAADAETYEILRVENGQPGPMGELTEEYTPLEIGYQDLISGSKGCYTGQEIIARQITYDKITKILVGVKLNQPVEVGSSLVVDGKSVGTLTSISRSPRFGIIGLGVIRRQFSEPGSKLTVFDASGAGILAEVANLPFS